MMQKYSSLKVLYTVLFFSRDALIISAVNTGTSLFSGFVIFSFIGYMSKVQNVDVSTVATSG